MKSKKSLVLRLALIGIVFLIIWATSSRGRIMWETSSPGLPIAHQPTLQAIILALILASTLVIFLGIALSVVLVGLFVFIHNTFMPAAPFRQLDWSWRINFGLILAVILSIINYFFFQ